MSLKTAFFRLNDSSAAFEMVIFQKQNALEYLNVNWLAHMQAKRPFRQSGPFFVKGGSLLWPPACAGMYPVDAGKGILLYAFFEDVNLQTVVRLRGAQSTYLISSEKCSERRYERVLDTLTLEKSRSICSISIRRCGQAFSHMLSSVCVTIQTRLNGSSARRFFRAV